MLETRSAATVTTAPPDPGAVSPAAPRPEVRLGSRDGGAMSIEGVADRAVSALVGPGATGGGILRWHGRGYRLAPGRPECVSSRRVTTHASVTDRSTRSRDITHSRRPPMP